MKPTDLSRWQALWDELDASGDPRPWHERLIAAYCEPARHYHNLLHLDECLAELETVRTTAQSPAAIAAALWFHDGVYDPRASQNEEASAALAIDCLGQADVLPVRCARVRQ